MKKFLAFFLCFLILLTTSCTATDSAVATTATTAVSTTTLQDQGIQNIILIIGDGMGPNQVTTGQLYAGETFGFTQWAHTTANTNSINEDGAPVQTTDSAAAATALATGMLTTNGRVGRDADAKDLKTIMDYASQDYDKATGVISTDLMNGATPAGFSAHADHRGDTDDILLSQIKSGLNLLCSAFTGEAVEKRDLAKSAGYTYCDSLYEAKECAANGENGYWQLSCSDFSATDKLADVTTTALDLLDQDPDGFVLMIEQAQVDKHGHSNNFLGSCKCVNVLNDTVEAILTWLGDRTDTAIIITADHETGGLEYSSEPNFANSITGKDGSTQIYYNYTSTGHTPTEVDVYVYGFTPNFEKYYTEERPSSIKNTDIFKIMLNLLEDPTQEG